MKYYKIIAVLSLLTLVYFFNDGFGLKSDEAEKTANVEPISIPQKQTLQKINPKKINAKKRHKVMTKSLLASELFEKLQVPSNTELEHVWSEEYGCYYVVNDLTQRCKYNFLSASSLEEAIWMKNNGYPTSSMLDLIDDVNYEDELAELVRKRYPAALALASISAIEKGNFREAALLALSNLAYSDKSKTYPHTLYGEALLVDDKKIVAITKFYVAGLLGDPRANGRAMALAPDVPTATSALNRANNYLRRVFKDQLPYDPRPDGSG